MTDTNREALSIVEELRTYAHEWHNAEVCDRAAAIITAAEEALERLSALTPFRANAGTAQDLHLTVRAIADTALAKIRGKQL